MTIYEITKFTAATLVAEQFPHWAHLAVTPVEQGGIDNRTFRLGGGMLLRFPSAESYSLQVPKEQKWLPVLGPHLSFPIPMPLALGRPSSLYPWDWSIYNWLEGKSANVLVLAKNELKYIGGGMAQFLKELHKIKVAGAPPPGLHNYWRGDHVSVYGEQTRSQIAALGNTIDRGAALSLWAASLSSRWNHAPVWIHGDFASGNILVKNGKLAAVIDFGCMGVGDPACDLVIAWTLLRNEAREIFKEQMELDPQTWARARGWALWKATFELSSMVDKSSLEAKKHKYVIQQILNEHQNEKF